MGNAMQHILGRLSRLKLSNYASKDIYFARVHFSGDVVGANA